MVKLLASKGLNYVYWAYKWEMSDNAIGIGLGMNPINMLESCEDLCIDANDNGDLVELGEI